MSIFAWRIWEWYGDEAVWTMNVSVTGKVVSTHVVVTQVGVTPILIGYNKTGSYTADTTITTQSMQIINKPKVLRGLYGHDWPIGEAFQATCHYAERGITTIDGIFMSTPLRSASISRAVPLHAPDEGIPAVHCSCGIYALKHAPNPMVTNSNQVFGVVEIWGKIITAELGYRAEYAQLRALVSAPDIVTETYQIPNLPSIKYAKKEYFE